MLNALDRLAGSYASECTRIQRDLAIAESQLRDYQARLGAPFVHDAYLSELTNLRDQLKAGLSGATPEPGDDPRPGVSELAEKIKALKAGHSIEATPQRVQQKHLSAEEPVTARIRRRTHAVPVSNPAIEPDVSVPEADPSPLAESAGQALAEDRAPDGIPSDRASMAQPWSVKPHLTFQQRLALERRRNAPEPSLP